MNILKQAIDNKKTKKLIKGDNIEEMIEYAKKTSITNVKKLEEAIIKRCRVDYILQFAKEVPGADIEKLGDAMIKKGNSDYVLRFAKEVPGADVGKLEDAIIKNGGSKYILRFAKEVPGANITKLEDAICKNINSRCDLLNILQFAKEVPGADVEKLGGKMRYKIIQSRKVLVERVESRVVENDFVEWYNYGQPKYVSKPTILHDIKVVTEVEDCHDIVLQFAKEVPGADIKDLSAEIIRGGNFDYILRFIREVPGADLEWMEDYMLRFERNARCSAKFLSNFKTTRFMEHIDIILESGTFGDRYLVYMNSCVELPEETKQLLKKTMVLRARSIAKNNKNKNKRRNNLKEK